MEADFSGYATKNGLKCSDGRIIHSGAFKDNDGQRVPLVWQHQYNEPTNILGHAMLENRDDGVYAYGYFNDTEAADHAKKMVKHGDITALSIYANKLVQQGSNVLHGAIREVSLVLSGANPGAFIDNVNIQHGDVIETVDDEAIIYTGLEFEHEDTSTNEGETVTDTTTGSSEKTVQDVFEELTEEQKNVVYFMIGAALEEAGVAPDDAEHGDYDNEYFQHMEGDAMTRNVFDRSDETPSGQTLSHSEVKAIFGDAEKCGSLKEAFLAHAQEYGIQNIDILFPDAKTLDNKPEFISRRMEWVSEVINGIRHSPFSRIKSMSADITHEEARARGYIKGNLKKEEFFALAKRETGPTTIYKKQKLDRDDIIDVTTLDVVAWLKAEMRVMLDEEIARAVLFGDGRDIESEDKIDETKIRPIAKDDDFYSHKITLPNQNPETIIEQVIRSRRIYKGTGTPTLFISPELLTDLLMVKDTTGRRIYRSEEELKSELRVGKITEIDLFDQYPEYAAIMVNLGDYTIGTDAGGNVSMFDDFDIDYNQYKYLIEGRMSGSLTRHKTAVVFLRGTADGQTNRQAAPDKAPAAK